MGFFDMLFGRPDPVRPWSNWDELDQEKRQAAGQTILQRVAERMGLQGATTRCKGGDIFLRGETGIIHYRVKLDVWGSGEVELTYRGQELTFIDLTHDPDLVRRPGDKQDAFDEREQRVWVSDAVFTSGSRAQEEAERFRELPAELQQRVVSAMLRCNIRYFRSRPQDHATSMRGKLTDVEDPVAWLAEVLELSLAVARYRIADAEAQRKAAPKAPKKLGDLRKLEDLDRRAQAIELLVAPLACAREKGARVVARKNDNDVDVRWTTQGVAVRLIFDFHCMDLEAQARADGVNVELYLDHDEDVTVEDEGAEDEWSDAADLRVFLAQGIFVTGSREHVREQVELLRSLPEPLLDELLGALAKDELEELSLSEGFLCAGVTDLEEAGAKELARAERIAELLARVASKLPRGGATHLEAAVRCKYCRALWYPGPGHEKCAHCGAPV